MAIVLSISVSLMSSLTPEDGSVFHQYAAGLGNLPGTAFAADELKLFH